VSTIGCTSFFPSKPLGCYGDGGAIFTSDDKLAQAMREIRVHGQSGRYHHTRVGVGGRMDTLQCAVVLAKLERFDWEVTQRIAIGDAWARKLKAAGLPLELVTVREGRDSVWAQYTVKVDAREAVQAALKEQGVPTAVHYPVSLNMQPAYRHLGDAAATPLSHVAAGRVMSLPMHPDLDEATQDRIVAALGQALAGAGAAA
ncbi:MAG: DegT/DnrJ/EryC1/StrS family aminotransferase, partial [Burkholderiaceae bacterium]|nr:DegT/DnrJ/EryC1/StrS family aminotransferase [Burkholderiaceae bacterium]